MALPIIGHQNSAQIRVAVKLNAHQIKEFALEPARARPNGNEGINVSMISRNASAEADLLFLGDRGEVILQLETRLDGEAIDASCVGEQVELQRITTFLRACAQKATWDNNGRFAVKFDDFFDRFWIPRAQMLDDSISVLVCVIRHSF